MDRSWISEQLSRAWVESPDCLQRPWVIAVALVFFAVALVVDKISYLDSAWDAVHTFIRPVAGALLMGASDASAGTVALAGSGATLALLAHVAKASTGCHHPKHSAKRCDDHLRPRSTWSRKPIANAVAVETARVLLADGDGVRRSDGAREWAPSLTHDRLGPLRAGANDCSQHGDVRGRQNDLADVLLHDTSPP